MTKGGKIAVAGGALALLLLFAGSAAAKPDEPAEPPGPLPPPPEQPPAKPDPKRHDYVGSGYVWPHKDAFPNELAFGFALQQLGYATNPLDPAWSPISGAFMSVVRQFQRDYNVVRPTLSGVAVPKPPVAYPNSLATDGLIGKNTVPAIIMAKWWVANLGKSWQQLVGAS